MRCPSALLLAAAGALRLPVDIDGEASYIEYEESNSYTNRWHYADCLLYPSAPADE